MLPHESLQIVHPGLFLQTQGPKAQIGIALNCMFHAPADPSSKDDCMAAERGNVFELGWFADPLYLGDYPEVTS